MSASPLASPLAPASGAPLREGDGVARGLACVLVAVILLPGQDAIAKYLSSSLSPALIGWLRFIMQCALSAPLVLAFHGWRGFWPRRPLLNIVRGLLIAASSTLFFGALKLMPLADALAIFFVEPFVLILLAALVNKEPVSRGLAATVAVGFLGVLLVVQPSYAVFGVVSLLPALAGTLFAVYTILNRRGSAADHPLVMQFAGGFWAFVALGAALAVGHGLGISGMEVTAVPPPLFGWLLLMGVLGTTGHFAFVLGARLAPASLIAPLQYVETAAAAALGYLAFGEFPDPLKWLGIAIIVVSGIAVLAGRARGQASKATTEG